MARGFIRPTSAIRSPHSPALQKALFVTPEKRLLGQWLNLIGTHFGLYLRVRAEVFRWVALTPDISKCHPYYVGVSGTAGCVAPIGTGHRPRARRIAFCSNYGRLFVGTPVFSHITFGVIALIVLVHSVSPPRARRHCNRVYARQRVCFHADVFRHFGRVRLSLPLFSGSFGAGRELLSRA